MLQDPTADKAMGFKADWLEYFEPLQVVSTAWNRYLLVDPASSKKRDSDYTVATVIALCNDGNYRLLYGVRDRLNLTERARLLFSLHRKYRPLATGYEQYGMQADVEHIRFVQQLESYVFPIIPLGGQMSKVDRIKRLIPLFEQHRFLLPRRCLFVDYESKARDFTQLFVDEEYTAFPVPLHDDMLDCVSRVLDPDLKAVFPREKQEVIAPVASTTNADYDLYREL
jgi:phage terminase large subunit-like protein